MSEPMRNHNYDRLAWVNLESEHDCQQAIQKIQFITVRVVLMFSERSARKCVSALCL